MGVYASTGITYNISGEFSYTVPELYNGTGQYNSNLTSYLVSKLKTNVNKFKSITFAFKEPTKNENTTLVDVGYNPSEKQINDSYVAYCTLNSNSMYDIVVYSRIGNKIVLPQNSAYMFYSSYDSKLTTLDVSSLDTSKVTSMS